MSKYKVGDKVKVREDLNENLSGVVDRMIKYKGQVSTITNITRDCDNDEVYCIDLDENDGSWFWRDDNFEELVEEQIEIPQSKEKYVKCTNNCFSGGELILGNTYIITFEDGHNCEIKGSDNLWSKSRFIEIPNPQNPVKSSVSEPLKSNKMELLMPVLDIIERLQELEIDKDNVGDMVNGYYINKIKELENKNSELTKRVLELEEEVKDLDNTIEEIATILNR